MAMQKATVGAILAVAVISIVIVTTLGALVATRTITNNGSITAVGVGVYSDSACTTPLSSISWAALNPGGTETYTMYVNNTGTVPVTLNMTTTAWSPSTALNYITLAWNLEGSTLPVATVAQAVLTLSVLSSITGITSFSFNITITGSQ